MAAVPGMSSSYHAPYHTRPNTPTNTASHTLLTISPLFITSLSPRSVSLFIIPLHHLPFFFSFLFFLFQVNSIHMMNDVLDLKGFYDISATQKKVVWFDVATCIAGIMTTDRPL